jgi:hypothetical protein
MYTIPEEIFLFNISCQTFNKWKLKIMITATKNHLDTFLNIDHSFTLRSIPSTLVPLSSTIDLSADSGLSKVMKPQC